MSVHCKRVARGTNGVASRRVLIPIEQTQQSSQTVEWYFKNLMQPNDQLIFVHITEPRMNNALLGLRMPNSPVLVGTQIPFSSKLLNDAKTLCGDYVHRAMSVHGITARGFVYVDSKPRCKLIRVIQSHNADLVLLPGGNRQRSFWDTWKRKNGSGTLPIVITHPFQLTAY
ncbi:unnamed protein product [Echinostoma caproni]|uniref:Usp domain-containing protein n=1 Tax=Echinostoma caproni TaxID=27848 RepID=A0A183AUB5_9TREM|nr:unnamed protein product [Echinostoma caproni]